MADNKKIDGMLTASEVARLLNVHINTVRRWSNQGALKAYRIGSRGDRRFRPWDIAGFLNSNSKRKGQPLTNPDLESNNELLADPMNEAYPKDSQVDGNTVIIVDKHR